MFSRVMPFAFLLTLCYTGPVQAGAPPVHPVEVSVRDTVASSPLDGRMLLLISTDGTKEPRFQIRWDYKSQQVFGVTVDGLMPGQLVPYDDSVLGYPAERLSDLPPGDYWVQGLLHKYETFHRADGHTVKLPMDRGEGQQWNRAPGNLYSKPKKVRLDPKSSEPVRIVLDQVIPPIEPPEDTKYVKHVRIPSKLLTKFWGRPMYLGAYVLIPEGFDEHPEARYPLIINHGHFPHGIFAFRETPPDPNLKPTYSERFRLEGYNRIQQEYAYENYKQWIGPNFPRFVIIEIEHANPYYDDSYAVNSANLGPYGDAIMKELVPFIEKKFRCLGQGWARFTYGGSTGGWEALAVQVMYPDDFNGCFAACPDPIDFRAYVATDIYDDDNAYYDQGPFARVPRPAGRDYLGRMTATLEAANRLELVLGTKSRSGGQFDIWQAVFGPVGADGYPKPIWDKRTGKIDHEVAKYWRHHYDLRYILDRDWSTLGPKLEGKIHIYCGTADNYYLNNAVQLMEQFLKSTTDPYYAGEVDYGVGAEHCWNGDQHRPNATSRLRYNVMYVDKILDRIKKAAPDGADLTSWRY